MARVRRRLPSMPTRRHGALTLLLRRIQAQPDLCCCGGPSRHITVLGARGNVPQGDSNRVSW
ncbi:hypothetical protein DPMN_083538 [Dreissena polymorpha]|uniref:Uncharacterized protein n=1 Tax=Dreissena polymorpha TaxID=45954 RepID=A0A9D3YCR6_DREPO|nr:hypothetical protein DPMN_083538 [Dreissena polymorpha]